jgi:cell division transport system permease protein
VLTSVSLLLGAQTERLRDHWAGRADITVYLCTRTSTAEHCRGTTTTSQIESQEGLLARNPQVLEYWFEDRNSAWAAFTERFSGSSLLESLDANALPESYRIKLSGGADREAFIEELHTALTGIGGFDVVQDQRDMLSGFFTTAEKVRIGALLLAALQACISIALTAHLLRASIAKRAKDIRVMGLVGTPRRQIRAPFVLEALAVYSAGVVVAGTLVVVALNFLRRILRGAGADTLMIVDSSSAVGNMLLVYSAGLLLGWVTVRITLRARLRET